MNHSSASKQRFARDVLIAGAANLARSLRGLILLPIITGHLSLAHYGEWEMLTIAIAFLTPWITFSLGSALIRFLPGQDDAVVSEGFYSIFCFVLFSSGLAAFALWLLATPLSSFPALAPLARNSPAIAFVLVGSSLLGIVLSYFRAFRLMFSHSLLSLSQHFIEVVLIAYLLQTGAPLADALWAFGATRALLMTVGLIRIATTRGITRPRFAQLRAYLAFAIPLIPSSLFYQLYDQADRFFIYAFIDATAVGTYAAAYWAGSLFTTFISPIHTVLLPAMAALWNQHKKGEIGGYLTQTVRFSALVAMPLLAGGTLLSEPLLAPFVLDNPGSVAVYFPFLAVSFIFFGFGIPFGDLMATAGQSRRLFYLNGGLALANLLLNLLLVPLYGIAGAVFSTIACHFTYAVGTSLMARSILTYKLPWGMLARNILAATAMALVIRWIFGSAPTEALVPVLIGAMVYIVLLFALGALTKQDLYFFANLIGIKTNRPNGKPA